MEFPDWLTKIKQARKRDELFAILDDFRIGEWTDEQRATVGRLYIRLLENMQPSADAPAPSAGKVPVASGALKAGANGGTGADVGVGAAAVKAPADGESEADGPVWYEKM